MHWVIGAWFTILGLGLLYSAKFSYRDALDRPLMFHRTVLILRLANIFLLAVLIILALRRHAYLFGSMVLVASFGLPYLIQRHAYNRELRRMANFQVN